MKALLLIMLATLISACSGGEVRKNLGLNKDAPDEFMVISRPPLTIPPDFTLPAPGKENIIKNSTIPSEAKALVFDDSSPSIPSSRSTADLELLKQAKTYEANPKIRNLLEDEARVQVKAEKEKGFLDEIRETLSPSKSDLIIDPSKEEERLAENARQGKHPSEGAPANKETGGKKGVLNQLFDM